VGIKFKLTRQNIRKLIVIPLALLALAIFFIGLTYVQEGTILKRGIDLEGGTQLTIHYSEPVDMASLKNTLGSALGTSDIDLVTTTNPATRVQETLIISVGGDISEETISTAIESALGITLSPQSYSIRVLGPALASSFWRQAKWAFAFAFLFMAGVVAFYFRKPLPSLAIIISAVYDLIIILGFMALTGMHLSLATIAAVLMIIGYSVDTNILLTNKIIRERDGELFERINRGMKTGLTMSASTISVLLALLFVGGAYSIVLRQIATILLVGLLADIPNTWLLNSNLLTWHQE
jgi:preprotein translocase subunit SecF|tara:strand:- start:2151 stop:3032 length:882 start_codon:yes stop_codon:yes gene_type:complete